MKKTALFFAFLFGCFVFPDNAEAQIFGRPRIYPTTFRYGPPFSPLYRYRIRSSFPSYWYDDYDHSALLSLYLLLNRPSFPTYWYEDDDDQLIRILLVILILEKFQPEPPPPPADPNGEVVELLRELIQSRQ